MEGALALRWWGEQDAGGRLSGRLSAYKGAAMGQHHLRRRTFIALVVLTVGALGLAGTTTLTRSGAAGPKANRAAPPQPLPFRNGARPSPSATAPVLRPRAAAALPAGPASSLVNDPLADPGLQDTQSETTVVRVGSSDNLVASYNDSGSFTSPDVVQFTGYSTSADGGRTWTDRGALPANPLGDLGDPVLAYSARADAVLLTTLECVSPSCEDVGPGVQVFTSNDAGVSFGTPTAANFDAESAIDKEWIAADNFPGSRFGTLYLMARDFGIGGGMELLRSIDDGATWTSPIHIADGGQGAFVTVTPDHAVQAFWLDDSNKIQVRTSNDGGATFGGAHLVAALGNVVGNGDVSVNGGPRSNGFVHVGVAPDTGDLFAVYNDKIANAASPDVFLTSSTDGGTSWATPSRINSDATGDQWSPTVAIGADGATAMLSWYDRRNDPANASIQRFGAIGRITGGTMDVGPNVALSTPFPVVIAQDPVVNPVYMGDYDMIAAGPDGFVATWGDNGGASAAHAHQPDVRAAVLPRDPAAAELSLAAAAPPSIALGDSGTIGYDVTVGGAAAAASLTISTTVGSALGTPTSPGAECSGSGQVAACLFGDLVDGTVVHVDVPIVPLTPGTLHVSATVAHAGTDPTPADDSVVSDIEATGSVPLERTTSTDHCDIPDLTTVECPLVVGPSGPALNVTVGVRLRHTFVGDLQVSVVAPDGTVVPLAANPFGSGTDGGFGTGPDQCDDTTVYTTFRDDAERVLERVRGAVRRCGAPDRAVERPRHQRAVGRVEAAYRRCRRRGLGDTAVLVAHDRRAASGPGPAPGSGLPRSAHHRRLGERRRGRPSRPPGPVPGGALGTVDDAVRPRLRDPGLQLRPGPVRAATSRLRPAVRSVALRARRGRADADVARRVGQDPGRPGTRG